MSEMAQELLKRIDAGEFSSPEALEAFMAGVQHAEANP